MTELLTRREQLVDTLGNLKNAMVTVVTVTDQEALQKSRLTGSPTPENLQKVKKFAKRDEQLIGADYETVVKKLRFKEAGLIQKVKIIFTGDKFKAGETYTVRLTENGAVLQHKDKGTKYLRTLSRPDSPVKSEYYDADGSNLTETWHDLRDEYFKKAYSNKKQELEDPVIVNNTKLDNVKYIRLEDGTVIFNELTEPILRKLGL